MENLGLRHHRDTKSRHGVIIKHQEISEPLGLGGDRLLGLDLVVISCLLEIDAVVPDEEDDSMLLGESA